MRAIQQRIMAIQAYHADFLVVLLLFCLFRLMMLLAYPAPCLLYCGDYLFYFQITDLSRQGLYPYIHFWYEYPPLYPALSWVAYTLAQGVFQNYVSWLGVFLLLADGGTLVLLYMLARRLYTQAVALKLSWVYALLFVPLYVWRTSLDGLVTFFVLLTLYALLSKKYGLVGLSLGLGAMVKYMPLALLPTIYRYSGLRRMLQSLALALAVSLIIFGPFFILGTQFSLASLKLQVYRSSWQSIWALIDGNQDNPGGVGPMNDRFDITKTVTPFDHPPRISPLLTLLIFGGIGLYVFLRPARQSADIDTVTFAAFTIVIFFLWSKGWSPEWQSYLIPLLLLTLPLSRALLYIISLSFINFLTWPTIYQRGLTQLLPVMIIARTFLFVLLAYELYRVINPSTRKEF